MFFSTVHPRRSAAALLCAALLGACAPVAVTPPALAPPATGADAREAWYRDAEAGGAPILRLDPQRSLITVIVHRGGALARLGHDHAVASRTVEGFVAPEQGRADFHFRLDQMTVDEAGLRQEAGFDTQPSEAAIAGTRTNMLTRVLDAERFPLVLVHAERAAAEGPLSVTITLHGVARTLQIPVRIDTLQGRMSVSGAVSLKQSDFGIVPFSVMAGALAVEDRMDLRFTLVATPRPGDAATGASGPNGPVAK
ncbi:MAG TPA: YceI family protein [Janthinobacterium sp.]|nr:YceI family protein [Janthinobacterium sp.]